MRNIKSKISTICKIFNRKILEGEFEQGILDKFNSTIIIKHEGEEFTMRYWVANEGYGLKETNGQHPGLGLLEEKERDKLCLILKAKK